MAAVLLPEASHSLDEAKVSLAEGTHRILEDKTRLAEADNRRQEGGTGLKAEIGSPDKGIKAFGDGAPMIDSSSLKAG